VVLYCCCGSSVGDERIEGEVEVVGDDNPSVVERRDVDG
jgi:hypothetical protein